MSTFDWILVALVVLLVILAVWLAVRLAVTRNRLLERADEQDRKFGMILENLPCVVYQAEWSVSDGEVRVRYINGRVDIYGLEAEDVLHNPKLMIERTHPEDIKNLMVEILDAGKRMQPTNAKFRVYRTDGQLIWIETRDVPLPLPDGSILWTGYAMDITARHEAEERLRASEGKFRTLVESANDIIYTVDPAGRINYVSPSWTGILGHPIEDIVGRVFSELLHPDDLESAREFLSRVVNKGQKQENMEYRVRRQDGAWVWHTANGAPLFDSDGTLVGMICIARDISERKETESRILHMAHHDALTDLPNRSLFFDRLQQALHLAARHQRKLALMFVDLDHFKPINDTYGHDVGDRVLQEAAQRMSKALRGSDAIGRIGGDEFAVLLSEIDSIRTAFEVLAKIRDAIHLPIQIGDLELQISCSIGVAIYPDHGTDAPSLFRHADLAMYRAKETRHEGVEHHQLVGTEPAIRFTH